MNQKHNPSGDSTSDQAANASVHFGIAMRNFNGLLRTNSLGQALVWARQGALLAAASKDDENIATSREAYVALILVSAAKFEAQTLHCGNITDSHKALADIIAESTDCLVESYRNGSAEIPLMVALAIQGFTTVMREQVTAVVEDSLPTLTSSIEAIFQHLDQIVTHASGLTRTPETYGLSGEEKIIAAADAMSNSTYELSWLLPSDWAKAIFYARRTATLISRDLPSDRPGIPASTPPTALVPLLQPVLDALPPLILKLTAQEYRESKRRIKAINAIFETLVKRG
jgi:hypothetical protein